MPKVKKEDNVLYAGADEWVNTRTGQVITANQIIKKTDRNGFMITYLSSIITTRTGAIMITPELIHKGNKSKEQYLLTKFQEFDE